MRIRIVTIVLGLLIVAAAAAMPVIVPVSAAPGEPLALGEFNTAQRAKTTLWANTNQWALRIKQARVGSAALKLETAGGPPMIVNSADLVHDLNADFVDGYDADRMRSVDGACVVLDPPDGQDWTCTYPLTPTSPMGAAHVVGSATVVPANLDGDVVGCRIVADDAPVAGSERAVGAAWGTPATCTAHASWIPPVGDAQHQVGFELYGIEPGTAVTAGSMNFIYVP
jgi:hypothetical protein